VKDVYTGESYTMYHMLALSLTNFMTRCRTGEIFAVVLFKPGMPSLLTLVSMDMDLVTKHDGNTIAGDIQAVCTKYNNLKIMKSQVLMDSIFISTLKKN